MSSFQPVAARRRLALIMVILAAFYLAFDVYIFIDRGLFLFIGVDYRTFWTSALIAHTQGFVPVYNLELGEQTRIQQELVEAFARPGSDVRWATIPTPYLPIFVAFFEPFLLLPPAPGWAVWTLLNVVATYGYLIWFWRKVGGRHEQSVLLALCLSFPALETFQFGQVNAWLMIFMGEFFRNQILGHQLRSGLWLSGLLLKPQTLMVIGPGLLIGRRWRTLGGATLGGVVVLLASLAVAGLDGLLEDARLVLLYSGSVASTVPRDMMNWRSLAFHLSDAGLPNAIAWGIAIAGLIATYLAGLALWFWARESTGPRFATIVLGSYAATAAVAWHSHTHMGLPMVIPLLYLATRAEVSYRTLAIWLITPYLVFAILRVVFDLGHVGVLAVNLYLLGWAITKLRHREASERTIPTPALGSAT